MKSNIDRDYWQLPERLKQLRKENNISMNQLAKDMGVGRITISNWENNDYIGKVDTVAAVADYFNVSVDWLIGRTDSRNINLEPQGNSTQDFLNTVSKMDSRDILGIAQFLMAKFLEVQNRKDELPCLKEESREKDL